MKKLTIGASPLTGTIYAGTTIKAGTWAAGKQDVTEEAISAVAQSLMHTDEYFEFTIGKKSYILQVIEKPA